jgi:hypothetical protein
VSALEKNFVERLFSLPVSGGSTIKVYYSGFFTFFRMRPALYLL